MTEFRLAYTVFDGVHKKAFNMGGMLSPKLLAPQLIATLSQFANQRETSAYQISKMLDNTPFVCRYKNIWERVQTLSSLRMIRKVNKSFTDHGAIYFTLTSYGIEVLFAYGESDAAYYSIGQIVKNYGNDRFFKMFAYMFEKSTLENIVNPIVDDNFKTYFSNCARGLWVIRRDLINARELAKKNNLSPERLTDTLISHRQSLPIRHRKYLTNLAYSITLMAITEGNPVLYPKFEFVSTRDHDLRLLTNDRQFSRILVGFKKRMIRAYEALMKYSDNKI